MTRVFFTIGALLVLSVGAIAQKASASGQGDAAFILDSGATIEGHLQNTLDVKNAKVGDSVILKTTKALKENGKTVVPKGSKLLGRVTDVQQRTKSDNNSRLGLLFDRLEGGDLSSHITASIVSITNASPARLDNTSDADLFASSRSSSGSASSSGGLLGGGGLPAAGLLGGVSNTVGSTLNTGTAAVGNVAGTASNTLGSASGSVINTVNGIQINPAVSGSAHSSATLEAQGRNIRLEKGTTMQLHVTSMPKEE
jgi:hypothetical protein